MRKLPVAPDPLALRDRVGVRDVDLRLCRAMISEKKKSGQIENA
jgi:hypothetical protein